MLNLNYTKKTNIDTLKEQLKLLPGVAKLKNINAEKINISYVVN